MDAGKVMFYSTVRVTVKKPKQIGVRECLLSFGAESVVFQVAIQKLKDQNI
jgi:hypothetical protein